VFAADETPRFGSQKPQNPRLYYHIAEKVEKKHRYSETRRLGNHQLQLLHFLAVILLYINIANYQSEILNERRQG
jgi:hypothetical protein